MQVKTLLSSCAIALSCTTAQTASADPSLISAFFGLDNAIPLAGHFTICPWSAHKDGMPIIFSEEINPNTLDASDFKVTKASGGTGHNHCVTLAPATDSGELRTALLVGWLGSSWNQPVQVEIVGDVYSLDGSTNFKGTQVSVTPLEAGPSIVLGEILPESQWELGSVGTPAPVGGGTGCPVEGTVQVVRATWDGGITKPNGNEVDDVERQQYRVTVEQEGGYFEEVIPFALGDLNDGDNNHELCLDVSGTPTQIYFPAGYMTDPRGDYNINSTIAVQ